MAASFIVQCISNRKRAICAGSLLALLLGVESVDAPRRVDNLADGGIGSVKALLLQLQAHSQSVTRDVDVDILIMVGVVAVTRVVVKLQYYSSMQGKQELVVQVPVCFVIAAVSITLPLNVTSISYTK